MSVMPTPSRPASDTWRSSHALPIHAFDQPETLLGQGTLAREINDQAPNAATVLVAVGGGGLIGGVASWYANETPRVIGVEPVGAPTLTDALRAGRPVDAPAGSVAADSLAPRRVGTLMFPIAQQHVDRVLLVEDEDIVRAQEVLWDVFGCWSSPAAPLHSPQFSRGDTRRHAMSTW